MNGVIAKQIIDLIGKNVSITGNSTVDGIISAIIAVISFSIAWGGVDWISNTIGIYRSRLMSDTHWFIRVFVCVGLTWVGVKIAQFIRWLLSFQWWVYVTAGVVCVGIIVLIFYIKSRISKRTSTGVRKATKEQKIQWLCQIIENECKKPESERDTSLLCECTEYLRELSGKGEEATPEQKQHLLQEIKTHQQH